MEVRGRFSLALLLCCAFMLSLCLPASAAEKTIGIIIPDIPYYRELHSAFMARLSKGKIGSDLEIIVQKPYPDPISLSNAARKLIALDVDVIVTYGTPATLAAVREKTKIPIVYSGVYDPFVAKLKAKNITGVSSKVSVSSLLRYLRGFASISDIGVIYNSNEEDSFYQLKEIQSIANQYGFKIEELNLKRPADTRAVLSGKKVDALFITGSSVANVAAPSIMEFSREHRIPTASVVSDRNSHATVTLCANLKEQGELAAEMVAKILEGVPPERIKADSGKNIELVFNLKEAKAMGFRIPMDLITESTRLIQ